MVITIRQKTAIFFLNSLDKALEKCPFGLSSFNSIWSKVTNSLNPANYILF